MLRNKRIAVVHLVLGGFAAAIVVRAAQVQVWQGKQWQAKATRQHVAASSIPAPRGLIVDASGNPARRESRARADRDRHAGAARCAKKSHASSNASGSMRRGSRGSPIRSESGCSFPAASFRATSKRVFAMRGVYATPVGERVYAASGGAERIIGHANAQGEGMDGIELVLDSLLRGTKGTVSLVKDVRGRRFESPDELSAEPAAGTHGHAHDQRRASGDQRPARSGTRLREMGADGGDIVVLDPNTGEIRAMASRRRDPLVDGRDGDHRAVSAGVHAQAIHGGGAAGSRQGARGRSDRDVQRHVQDIRPNDSRRAHGAAAVARRRHSLLEQHRHRAISPSASRRVSSTNRCATSASVRRPAFRIRSKSAGTLREPRFWGPAVAGVARDGLRDLGDAAAARARVRVDRQRRRAARAAAREGSAGSRRKSRLHREAACRATRADAAGRRAAAASSHRRRRQRHGEGRGDADVRRWRKERHRSRYVARSIRRGLVHGVVRRTVSRRTIRST